MHTPERSALQKTFSPDMFFPMYKKRLCGLVMPSYIVLGCMAGTFVLVEDNAGPTVQWAGAR